jgi:head-tail adaptor
MGMQAGKLRRLVTIQRQSVGQDSTGQETGVGLEAGGWTTYTKLWAHIEPYIGSARAGRELFSQEQLISFDYTRMHYRYSTESAGITPKDRVQFTDAGSGITRTFDILAINNRDERNYELEAIMKERQ